MSIQDVQNEFLFRLDKLGTNASQNIGLPQFVSLINKAQLHWAESRIKASEATKTRVDELQQLLSDYDNTGTSKENYCRVALPDDYFHPVRVYSTVKGCKSYVYGKFVEEGNVGTLLQGAFTKPSIAWEETLVTVFKDHLRVYFDGFTIERTFLKYYRLPKMVDIKGYIKSDGTNSSNVDLEFDDVNAQEIIDLAAQIAAADIGDIQRLQILARHTQENS